MLFISGIKQSFVYLYYIDKLKNNIMPLLNVLIVIIIVGVLMWLVNLIPMQRTIKSILNIVVVIILVIWLLNVFGIIAT